MIKFLFYLFLFYVIFRFVFGGLRFKVFHYHQNQPPPNPNGDHPHEEGKITINPKVQHKKPAGSDKLGEYVDYEEVK